MAAVELASTTLYNDASLYAYWKLENANTTIGSYNFSNQNTVGFAAALFNNGANLTSTNTNKCLYRSDACGITSTTNITLSLWVKVLTEPSSDGVQDFLNICTSTTAGVQYVFRYYENNGAGAGVRNLRFLRYGSGNYFYDLTGNLGTTNWHHLCMTYNGTNVRAYLDGTFLNQFASSGTSPLYLVTVLGMAQDKTTFPAKAMLDDFSIFTRALTDDEVTYIATGVAPSTSAVKDMLGRGIIPFPM